MSQILTLIFRKVFKEQHSVLIAKKWYLYHLVNDIYIYVMLWHRFLPNFSDGDGTKKLWYRFDSIAVHGKQ